jgi:hypothetical protein
MAAQVLSSVAPDAALQPDDQPPVVACPPVDAPGNAIDLDGHADIEQTGDRVADMEATVEAVGAADDAGA